MLRNADDTTAAGLWIEDARSPFKIDAQGAYGAAGTSPFTVFLVIGRYAGTGDFAFAATWFAELFRVALWSSTDRVQVRPTAGGSLIGSNTNLDLSGVAGGITLDDASLDTDPLLLALSFTNRTTAPECFLGQFGDDRFLQQTGAGAWSLPEGANNATTGRAIHLFGDSGVGATTRSYQGQLGPLVVRNHAITAAGFEALLMAKTPGALVDGDAELHPDYNGEPGCLFATMYGLATTEGDAQFGDQPDASNLLVFCRRVSDDWLGLDPNLTANLATAISIENAFQAYSGLSRVDVGARSELASMPAESWAGEAYPKTRTLQTGLASSGPPLRIAGQGNSRNNRFVNVVDGLPQTYLTGLVVASGGKSAITGLSGIPCTFQEELGITEGTALLGADLSDRTWGRFGSSQTQKNAARPFIGGPLQANQSSFWFSSRVGEDWGISRNDEIEAEWIVAAFPGSEGLDVRREYAASRVATPGITEPLPAVDLDRPSKLTHTLAGGDTISPTQLLIVGLGADPGVVVGDVVVNTTKSEIARVDGVAYNAGQLLVNLKPPFHEAPEAPEAGDEVRFGALEFVRISAVCNADASNPSRGVAVLPNGTGGPVQPVLIDRGGWATNLGGAHLRHYGKGGHGFEHQVRGDPAIVSNGWSNDQALQMPDNLKQLMDLFAPDVYWVTPATQSSTHENAIEVIDNDTRDLPSLEIVLAGDGLHQGSVGSDSFSFVTEFNLDWLTTLADGRGQLALDASRHPAIGRVYVDQLLGGQRHDLAHPSSLGGQAHGVAWLAEMANAPDGGGVPPVVPGSGGWRGRGRTRESVLATE